MSAEQARADQTYINQVLHVAWLRATADALFEWEQQCPDAFVPGGLGLLAAQLLDHAHCVEHHTAARPTVGPHDGGRL